MKIPQCDRCLLYSHQLDHVCVLHPFGVYEDHCLDFRQNPDIQDEEETSHEELWVKENYSWYGNKLIDNRPSRYTSKEQLEILDSHPFFTGTCPHNAAISLIPVRRLTRPGIVRNVTGWMTQYNNRFSPGAKFQNHAQ